MDDSITPKLNLFHLDTIDGTASPTISCRSSDAFPTPTHSVFSEAAAMSSHVQKHIEYHPQEGKTFVIRSHDKKKMVIELSNGIPQARNEQKAGPGIAWRCVKKQGWYGFVNTVSGTYLGHDNQRRIYSWAFHDKGHEEFMAERHPDGGYILLMKQEEGLWQVAIGDDGKKLVLVEKGGTAWDFINVERVSLSFALCQ